MTASMDFSQNGKAAHVQMMEDFSLTLDDEGLNQTERLRMLSRVNDEGAHPLGPDEFADFTSKVLRRFSKVVAPAETTDAVRGLVDAIRNGDRPTAPADAGVVAGPALAVVAAPVMTVVTRPPNPVEFLLSEPRDMVRMESPFPFLNKATRGGIPSGILTTILGAPHSGKTALAQQILKSASEKGYLCVALHRDEGRWAASVRLGQQLGLNRDRLESRDPEEMDSYKKALQNLKILVPDCDSPEWTLERSLAFCEREAAGKPWFLLVDSIQSVYMDAVGRNTREEIEAKMRILEGGAKRGGFVVAISEMNRGAYRHKDPKENSNPMAAAAESRAIEYVSRLMISLEGSIDASITANIVKNSPGGVREPFFLKFDTDRATFQEIDQDGAEGIREIKVHADQSARKKRLEDKIVKALESAGRELKAGELRDLVKGDAYKVDQARDGLVEDGRIVERPGSGRIRYFSVPQKVDFVP